jgi:hypothetical protein
MIRSGAVLLLLTAAACSSPKSTCSGECPGAGTTRCVGSQVELCEVDAGCLVWGAPHPCVAGQGCVAAQNGCVTCAPADKCTTVGATQCSGTQVQTCAVDATGCVAWGPPSACPSPEACDGPQGKCASCASMCPHDGDHQCMGELVQTCTADAGSSGCLDWSAAASCPAGQVCDSNQSACVDACTVQSVLALCLQAQTQLTTCCSGGFSIPTPAFICGFLVDAGIDPSTGCSNLSGQSCTSLHATAQQGLSPFPRPTCCCPANNFCDLSASDWACVPSCLGGADCPPTAPNCVPSVTDAGVIGAAVMICSADQGKLWRACDSANICCPTGSDCIEDANSNQFCSLPCSPTKPCGGDPTVVSCLTVRSCQNCDAGVCVSTTYCLPGI